MPSRSHANQDVDNGHIPPHTEKVTIGHIRRCPLGKETPMTNTRVLVTAATGKIGGAVAGQLLEQGITTRALVHRHDGRAARFRALVFDVVAAAEFYTHPVHAAVPGSARLFF